MTDIALPDPPARHRPRHGEAGFTLLEILVVIAILGLLIALVAPNVIGRLNGAKLSLAKQNIERLGTVLDTYKLDVGNYPTTEQGLQALVEKPSGTAVWNGPYIKGDKAPIDVWNHAYNYRIPSGRRGHDYDLCSGGPNNASGEAGTDGTICNQ